MQRTQIYSVPETEIEVNPGHYLAFIERYGKVEFILTIGTCISLKAIYRDLKELLNSEPKDRERRVSLFLKDNRYMAMLH